MISLTFFGTDQFAADILEPLITSGLFKFDTIITQPDRPTGRKQELAPAPVKELGIKYNIHVLQPSSLKIINYKLQITNSDIFVVFHYGLIIPQEILSLPKHGTLNLHPSLLPKYRGASPIRSALINGETETGVTVMLMDEKMDHGPILAQEKITIDGDDTNETLEKKITPLGIELLLKTIPDWVEDKIKPIPQNHDEATFSKLVSREDGKVDWNKSSNEIYNLYRGLTPWPGIWTIWNGKRLKLVKIKPADDLSFRAEPHGAAEESLRISPTGLGSNPPSEGGTQGGVRTLPGTIKVSNTQLFITCHPGTLEILELQLEGKKPMLAKEFLNGYKNFVGTRLT